uniref:RNA polymerase II subunit B1 CTD phosphatase RPAP2 homolog n=1 Tax=Anolis carolinensis TaxID=28377 RepID=G1KCW9_ANOCA|nr:PREDICTED: putative RNA polymerase II subunit B1 CTD phosphatase RPAP2 isoform X1 [Anolis carolinensis]XP_016848655.1 PREDICTED: putative RNA polymerase II subunit B1 CTD phosphatase RPAP2 isoform X2 [Anolis carolinensis]|eukprot:XP_003220143.1 PREDICTED: putative RNA polymerase II subunit B1 CTD phosphatase RPAP2 isoform X1 [Anolis carolinensis]
MAEERARSGSKARRQRRRPGNKQPSVLTNEDAAQRKAALEAAIRKKIEHERKALKVVERLLEDDITEEFLTNCGKLITPSHYKDVVEERFIVKLCGYPTCRNRLQNVPKQKYQISTKTNKVYDITERKCFCSNFCYRASKYFEGQISQSPVWLRDEERPPDIELLKEGARGDAGKEVKLVTEGVSTLDIDSHVPAAVQVDSSTESESGSSDAEQEFVSSILQENLSGAEKKTLKVPRNSILKKKPAERVQSEHTPIENPVNKAVEQLSRCGLGGPEEKHIVPHQSQTGKPDTSVYSLIPEPVPISDDSGSNCGGSQVVFLGMSQKGRERFKKLLAKSKQPGNPELKGPVDSLAAKECLLENIRQTFSEWKTEETLKLLYGSSFVGTCMPQEQTPAADCEKEELDEDDLDSSEETNTANYLMDNLNSLNKSVPSRDPSRAAKLVPSFEKLKEETSQLELKVKEFYQGKFTVAEEEQTIESGGEKLSSKDQEDQQWTPVFPLVDSKAQQQIRTQIVLEKLRKALPAVLGPLQIPLGDAYKELKGLIKTFRLTNTNIIHKMPVWTLIAIVLLSVLSEHIPIFANCLQSRGYTQFLATLLEELHFKHEDLESLTRIFKSDCLTY